MNPEHTPVYARDSALILDKTGAFEGYDFLTAVARKIKYYQKEIDYIKAGRSPYPTEVVSQALEGAVKTLEGGKEELRNLLKLEGEHIATLLEALGKESEANQKKVRLRTLIEEWQQAGLSEAVVISQELLSKF